MDTRRWTIDNRQTLDIHSRFTLMGTRFAWNARDVWLTLSTTLAYNVFFVRFYNNEGQTTWQTQIVVSCLVQHLESLRFGLLCEFAIKWANKQTHKQQHASYTLCIVFVILDQPLKHKFVFYDVATTKAISAWTHVFNCLLSTPKQTTFVLIRFCNEVTKRREARENEGEEQQYIFCAHLLTPPLSFGDLPSRLLQSNSHRGHLWRDLMPLDADLDFLRHPPPSTPHQPPVRPTDLLRSLDLAAEKHIT